MAGNIEMQDSFFEAIDVIINKRVEELDLDKTILATVETVVNVATGEHRLKYTGGTFVGYSRDGVIYEPNTVVYVQIPQNDFSKRKIILDRATTYRSEEDIVVVSSNINNYMPLGVNNLALKLEYKDTLKNGVGLNSYTPRSYLPNSTTEFYPFQDSIVLYDRATNKGIYDLNTDTLATYMQEADALMIKANFRTVLTQDQQKQSGAEYAIVADLVFKNVDDTYKTQGDMFAALENKTISQRTEANADGTVSTKNVSMGTYRKNLDKLFATSTTNSSATSINNQFNLIKAFIGINAESFTPQESAIFAAFTQLGAELSDKNKTYADKYLLYTGWFETLLSKEEASTKTLSYVIDSSRMVGNPFHFGSYLPQYSILPIDKENFLYIERIYFYCNNFIENTVMWQWVNENRLKSPIEETKTVRNVPYVSGAREVSATGYLGKDIWTKGLELYPLKEIADEYGGYKLKLSTPLGAIFYSTNEDEELKIQSTLTYKDYTDLTANAQIRWFKKDVRITAADQEGYDYHGGLGWYKISDSRTSFDTITLKASSNRAYKNEYMCAVSFTDDEQGELLLKQYITIYNESCKREIQIQSDLGVTFKFDAGIPTLTCLMGDDSEHLLEEFFETTKTVKRQDEAFQFYWSIRTGNGTVIPLDQTSEEIQQILQDTVSIVDRAKLETTKKYLTDVEYPKGLFGNKVKYPISKFATDSANITFCCQVFTVDNNNLNSDGSLKVAADAATWYSIGDAELTLTNQGMNGVSEYTVVIEGGDQVFQYSETGVTPVQASGVTPTDFRHTEPLEIQPLRAHLYYQNGLEVSENNYSVSWYYPTEESLIINPEGLVVDPATNNINMLQTREATFTIQDSYDYNAIDNQIQCVIKFNDTTYSKSTDFVFSKIGDNGTNGTDIVAKITVSGLDNAPLILFLGTNNRPIGETRSSSEGFTSWNCDTDDPILQLELYNRSVKMDTSEYNSYVIWNTACGISNTQYIELTQQEDRTKCKLHWNYTKTVTGTAYRCQLITVSAKVKATGQEYHCTLPFYTIQCNNVSGYDLMKNDFISKNITLDNKELLKQILYNSDGRNPQYNKNQGVKINGLEGRPIRWTTTGGMTNKGTSRYNNSTQKEDSLEAGIEKVSDYKTDTRKYDVPFILTKEKDSIKSIKYGTKDGGTTYYGLDKVYIHPSDTYAGESCDNNVIATIYNSADSIDKLTQYQSGRQDLEKQYQAKLTKISDKIATIYNEVRSQVAQSYRQGNETYREIESQLATYGITSILVDQNGDMIFSQGEEASYTLKELGSVVTDEVVLADIVSLATRYNSLMSVGQEEILKSEAIKKKLDDCEKEKENAKTEYSDAVSNLAQNYYSTTGSDVYTYEITIPIYMALNTFGLASLNAWDGTKVDINNDMGYVLAPQIGAGQKHNDNTFSGILMGSLESYDNYKVSEEDKSVGLMGFHHGLQSILLDAHTGTAIFGLPEEVRRYDNQGNLILKSDGTPSVETDYTQGRIILNPNGTSHIGAWKVGSRVLYNYDEYVNGSYQKPVVLLGASYSTYNSDGSQREVIITKGAPYENDTSDEYYSPAPEHKMDIEHQDRGLLLSSDPPYISVKGEVRTKDGDFIRQGESLEIQLDPQVERSPFAIYRHYQKGGEWKRQLRAGIDASGRFWSNALLNPSKDGNSAGSAAVQNVAAFGQSATDEEAAYAGLVVEVGPMSSLHKVVKMFVDGGSSVDGYNIDSPLYITTGTNEDDEYIRPISIHGKDFSFYADDYSDGASKQTNTKILLTNENWYSFIGTQEDDSEGVYLELNGDTDKASILRNSASKTFFILDYDFIQNIGGNAFSYITENYLVEPDGSWTIGKIAEDDDSTSSKAGTLKSGKDISLYSYNKTDNNSQGWQFVLSNDEAYLTARIKNDKSNTSENFRDKASFHLTRMGGSFWNSPGDLVIQTNTGKIELASYNNNDGITLYANGSEPTTTNSFLILKPTPTRSTGFPYVRLGTTAEGAVGSYYIQTHQNTLREDFVSGWSWQILPGRLQIGDNFHLQDQYKVNDTKKPAIIRFGSYGLDIGSSDDDQSIDIRGKTTITNTLKVNQKITAKNDISVTDMAHNASLKTTISDIIEAHNTHTHDFSVGQLITAAMIGVSGGNVKIKATRSAYTEQTKTETYGSGDNQGSYSYTETIWEDLNDYEGTIDGLFPLPSHTVITSVRFVDCDAQATITYEGTSDRPDKQISV